MKNILLIFGGRSAEREISILTAKQLEAMKPEGVQLFYICMDQNNLMFWTKELDVAACAKPELDKKLFTPVCISDGFLCQKKKKGTKLVAHMDSAIVACHGGVGENGELISKLNLEGIPTSVGNPAALAICMDKVLSKACFLEMGIPVLEHFWFDQEEWDGRKLELLQRAEQTSFPLIVKPARQGSSVGITMVKTAEEFEEAVELALHFDTKILVERALVDFRELNVSVMAGLGELQLSEVEEPMRTSDILSFEDKYFGGSGKMQGSKSAKFGGYGTKTCGMSGQEEENCDAKKQRPKKAKGKQSEGMAGSTRQFPANIDGDVNEQIKNIAKTAVQKLGLFGVVRLDFLYSDGQLFLNEINAVPGSLAYYFWVNRERTPQEFFSNLIRIAERNCHSFLPPIAHFL